MSDRRWRSLLARIAPERLRELVRRGTSPYRGRSVADVFGEIYAEGRWSAGGLSPVSGPGSSLSATEELRSELRSWLDRTGCRDMVDLGCGDFTWMAAIDLADIRYLGFDIVPELVAANRERYGGANVRFETADAADATIPPCDLLLCRDCLVHLSFADIRAALDNMTRSDHRFLALTHFPGVGENTEIPTGHWRPLNLLRPPISLPPPDEVLGDHLGQREAKRVLAIWKRDRVS